MSLRRKGFERYITEEERMEFSSAFVRDGILVEIVERVVGVVIPKTTSFLNWLSIARQPVSGDEDLLVLHLLRRIAIVTPQQFLEFPI
jgi:predicted nucleic acid-binding protein